MDSEGNPVKDDKGILNLISRPGPARVSEGLIWTAQKDRVQHAITGIIFQWHMSATPDMQTAS